MKNPVHARVEGWSMGVPTEDGMKDWLHLRIDAGPLTAVAQMSSRDARNLAIEILSSQAKSLVYYPPNEHMREQR